MRNITYISLFNCLFFLLFTTYDSLSQTVTPNSLPTAKQVAKKMRLVDSLMNQYNKNLASLTGSGGGGGFLGITGPEQDCDGAIYVCNQSYTQSNSYTGYGDYQEVYSTCLLAQEQNTVWYVFTVQNSGTFGFTIQTANDYDFALYDITSIGCSGIPTATPVRCNFSATYGATGIDYTDPQAGNISYNAAQAKIMPGLNVTAGTTYALIIDNYTGDENGYDLDFDGTAQIFDVTSPTLTSATYGCSNQITVTFSEPISCSSIASDGSDFSVSWSGPTITAAVGVNCTYNGLTTQVTITFTGSATSGTYTVSIQGGSGITDKCGNAILTSGTDDITYLSPITITPSATDVCSGNSSQLTATNVSGATYSWNPSGTLDNASIYNPTATPTTTTDYTVTVTWGGCSKTQTQTVTVTPTPVTSVSPRDPTTCTGTINLTATATIGGNPCTDCDYSWNGGTYTENNVASSTWTNRPAGAYSVVATSSNGCTGTTATTTVSDAASPPAPACNVIYVSPAGGGNGLTKTTPTDLLSALSAAECNNVVIKMQTGTYNLTDYITMTSFITLEGGYNAGFTSKTSDLSAGTSTRIVRDNTADSDNSVRCTAFYVQDGSSNFRFQDIRIELPSNHAASSAVTNYGIRLGTGCTNFDIVRCYIDAGTGANP